MIINTLICLFTICTSISLNSNIQQSQLILGGRISFNGVKIDITISGISNVYPITRDGFYDLPNGNTTIIGLNTHISSNWLIYRNTNLVPVLQESGFAQLGDGIFLVPETGKPRIFINSETSLSYKDLCEGSSCFISGANEEYQILKWRNSNSYSTFTKFLLGTKETSIKEVSNLVDFTSQLSFIGQAARVVDKISDPICKILDLMTGKKIEKLQKACDLVMFLLALQSGFAEENIRNLYTVCEISQLSNYSSLVKLDEGIKNLNNMNSDQASFYGFLENDDYSSFSDVLKDAMNEVIKDGEMINRITLSIVFSEELKVSRSRQFLSTRNLDNTHQRIISCRSIITESIPDSALSLAPSYLLLIIGVLLII